MKIIEAKEALERAVEDIAGEAKAAGFTVSVRSKYADVDFGEYDEYCDEAKIIFAELTVGLEGARDGMVYETAISITEGECSDDEMASEIGTMRSSVRELIAKVAEATDKIAAFNDELDLTDNDGEVVSEPVRDNKKFYIVASIIGGAALIIAAIIAAIV